MSTLMSVLTVRLRACCDDNETLYTCLHKIIIIFYILSEKNKGVVKETDSFTVSSQ